MRIIDYKIVQSQSGKYKIIYPSDIAQDEKNIDDVLKNWVDIYESIFSKEKTIIDFVSSEIKSISNDIDVVPLPDDILTNEITDRNNSVFLKNNKDTRSKAQSDRYDRYLIKSDSGKFIVAYKVDARLNDEQKKKIKQHLNNYEKSGLHQNFEQSVADYLRKNCEIEGKEFLPVHENDLDFVKENHFFVANIVPKKEKDILYSTSQRTKVICSIDSELNDGEKEWIVIHLDYYENNEKEKTPLFVFLQRNCGIKGREFLPPDNSIPEEQRYFVAFIQKMVVEKPQPLFEEKERNAAKKNELISKSGKSKIHYPEGYKMTEADAGVMQTVMGYFESSTDNKKPFYELLNSSITSEDMQFVAGDTPQEAVLVRKQKQEISVNQEPQSYAKKLEESTLEKKEETVIPKQDTTPPPTTSVSTAPTTQPNVSVNVNVQAPSQETKTETSASSVDAPTATSSTSKFIENNTTERKESVSEKSNLIKEYEITGEHMYAGAKNTINTISNFIGSIFGGKAEKTEKTDKSAITNVENNTSSASEKLSSQTDKIQTSTDIVNQSKEKTDATQTTNNITSDTAVLSTNTTSNQLQDSVVRDNKTTTSTQDKKDNTKISKDVNSIKDTEKTKEAITEKSHLEKELEITGKHLYEGVENVVNSVTSLFGSIFGGTSDEKKTTTNNSVTQTTNNQTQQQTNVQTTPSESKANIALKDKVIQNETTPSQESAMMQQATGELTNVMKTVAANAEATAMTQKTMQSGTQTNPQKQETAISFDNPTASQQQKNEEITNDIGPLILSGLGQQAQGMPATVSLTNSTIAKLASEIVKSISLSSFLNKGT